MRLRVATFNLESLDDRPGLAPSLGERIAALRPVLEHLDADVLCLQEVNAQETEHNQPRRFSALDALLADTRYAAFHRVTTHSRDGGPADVHNLVTLSRWTILEHRQVWHEFVQPPFYRLVTSKPARHQAVPVGWDRPLLYAAIDLPVNCRLHVLNLHLRAPLAAVIPGQKHGPFVWKSIGAWAEGFYLAAMKRTGQALEARLLVEHLFDADADAMIAVVGDLNAEARETPVRAIFGDVEDTGNPALAARVLSPIETDLPEETRFSVLHHGMKLMLDHVLVSPRLRHAFRRAEILNESLADEYFAYLRGVSPAGSFHAPIVAVFDVAAA